MLAIAAQYGSTQPRIVEADFPGDPGSGEVLCRTLELGICGTDREILHSARPLAPPGEERLILGHECLARVEAVGHGVAEFRVGELVVPVVRRATTSFSRRADLLPPGHYVERGIVHAHGFSQTLWLDRPEYLFRVPSAAANLAVFVEPLTVAEKGVNEALILTRARLGTHAWSEGQPPRVLVSGMGPIGFAGVIACVARGWPVTVAGRDEAASRRTKLAERLGATYCSVEAIEQAAADVERQGFDLLLECTGSDEVLVQCAALVRSCGAIAWLGSTRTPEPTTRDLAAMIRTGLLRNHVHVGCVNAAAPRDFQDALAHLEALVPSRGPALADLITARVKPADSLWHYEHRQAQGIKTVLMYDETE